MIDEAFPIGISPKIPQSKALSESTFWHFLKDACWSTKAYFCPKRCFLCFVDQKRNKIIREDYIEILQRNNTSDLWKCFELYIHCPLLGYTSYRSAHNSKQQITNKLIDKCVKLYCFKYEPSDIDVKLSFPASLIRLHRGRLSVQLPFVCVPVGIPRPSIHVRLLSLTPTMHASAVNYYQTFRINSVWSQIIFTSIGS